MAGPTTGSTILLIHGSGMSARSWTMQLEGLAGALSALAVDLPGHGESDPGQAANVEELADAVAAVVDALGIGPVIVAGHSLGGGIAIALAARRPDAVSGLVLLSSCERIPPSDGAAERLLAVLPGPLRRMVFFSMAKKVLFAPGAPDGAVSLGMDDLRSCRPETMLRDMGAAKAMDLAALAVRLNVPTLILCGSKDRLTPPALSERLCALIPRAHLRIVEGAGHMLPLECPDRVNRELLEFAGALEAVPAAALETPRKPSLAQRVRALTHWFAAAALSAVSRRSRT